MSDEIQNYLYKRTPREILLAKIFFIFLCIFIAWNLGVDDAIKRYFQPKKIQESPSPIPYLSYFNAQELITKYSTLISFSQSDTGSAHYTLKTQGKIQDENFFSLLNILKTYPAIKINEFSLDEKGDFSLTLFGENSQTYALPSSILAHSIPLTSPWEGDEAPISPLVLQALLNEKVKINGQWLGIGDKISGYTLQEIKRNGVILKNRTHTLALHLREKIF